MNSTGDAAKDYQLKKSLEELEADGSLVLTGSDVKSAKAETMENQTTKAKENIVSLVFYEGWNKEICRRYDKSV